jgi:hypothetical protein
MLFLGGTASILIDRSQEGARLSAGAFFFNGIAGACCYDSPING